MEHIFVGKWISNEVFAKMQPRNVFYRQLERPVLDCSEHRNEHILFRKRFSLTARPQKAMVYISADDYYKLYINGSFVAQGPAPSYHFRYNYNAIDVSAYLRVGENVIAVHTLYQGLINRVWQSGDGRHGMILDLVADGKTAVASDGSFLVAKHTGYREMGVCGYDTQFLEEYDSRAREVGFERPDFDDSDWGFASVRVNDDHTLKAQKSHMLTYEAVSPRKTQVNGNRILYDFGANYVGYLSVTATGRAGDKIVLRCAQELNADGTLRHSLRANCNYEEEWILAEGESSLDQFDYKSFRYAELALPEGVTVNEVTLLARHYPFALKAVPKREYAQSEEIRRIWALCIHTQKYGVQEVIQDCMEREKGFYLGDGCYTALTNMLLTGDDSMVRKLIDDAFSTSFITDTLVTCMNCSFMQEIAEYPLILVLLVLWHYRLTGDGAYLRTNYAKVTALLEAYRRDYEREGLLRDLDKWCVVEWPQNFQHGYDVDIREGKVCKEAHVAIGAYYLAAVRAANRMAEALGMDAYRNEDALTDAFYRAFYDPERDLFKDGESTSHISLVGNSFVYGLGLCQKETTKQNILAMLDEHGIHSLSLFCTFPVLMGLSRDGDFNRIQSALLDGGAWLRMLREDATTTFEGWGKDTKWNTSLFHLTMSYAALFIADADLEDLFST
ncbi:MAG: hypothetical protein E7657_06090 [Ruminococcaceae bacterium]|nr:hypothetical protein [Oscillospiraceae bacterium]